MEKLLEMKEICKSFGTNNVLKNVQFDLFAGEVHALIGENGAGKSTLMKILMGMYKKDSGSLSVLGSDEAYTNPDQALKAGVAMIHQELNPIPDMSVAENIFLGKEKRKWIFTSKKEQEKESKRYLDMLGIDLEPSVLMRELSVSEMQMVEIAKALSYGARIIIMDEPTSAITEAEVEKLFQNIKMLKEQGTGIIYISHKMDELFEISDRITVLRDGQYVFSKKTKDLCPNDLIKAMVGREITEIYPESKSKIGEVILKVKHASRKGEFKKIDFELRKGEKLGIAGLMGAGRTELMMAVFGAAKLEEGEIEIGGVPVRIQSPKDAIRQKIALVTEDRKRYGLNLTASVEDNAVSVIESSLSKFGFYRRKLGRKAAEEMISRMNTKVTGMDQIVGSLSGGNMQKVVLSKWLLNDPDIIIFDEPTRGIDVGAKAEIYKIIEELACKGKGIIIISSEMPELIGLSQRIIVLHEGEQTGELRGKEYDAGKYYDSCIGIQKGGKRMKVLSKNSVMEFVKKTAILWVMIILILILSVISPSFFRGQNLLNIIKQASITGVIGVGMTFVLITGGIDLSVGSVMALSGTMAASVAVAEKNMPIALVILVGVGLGALCGLINGIGVSYIGFPPFIMTLGMMTIARGIPLVFTNGTPIFGLSEEFNMIANSRVLGVPSLVIFLVITVLAGHIILSKTVLGRRIYAVGGNEDAARLSGVSTAKVKLFVYVFCGILSGIAGILICSRITSGNGTVAEGYEMNAISAAAIGGVSMTGGSGNVLGMVVGAMILTIIQNSFDIMGVNSFYQNIIKGIIILLAVFLDLRGKKKKN